MKTRAEIYGNEAAALLRIVTMYPGLNMQQLLCFHPGKEEIIKTLLSHLQKQGRIFQTDTGGYFPSGWAAKSDNSLIRAAWVLLDFIGQVEYHAPGDFPVKRSQVTTIHYILKPHDSNTSVFFLTFRIIPETPNGISPSKPPWTPNQSTTAKPSQAPDKNISNVVP